MSLGDYQKQARLMGILYGILVGMEVSNETITYDKIVDEMKQYCNAGELARVCQTIAHINELLDISKGGTGKPGKLPELEAYGAMEAAMQLLTAQVLELHTDMLVVKSILNSARPIIDPLSLQDKGENHAK